MMLKRIVIDEVVGQMITFGLAAGQVSAFGVLRCSWDLVCFGCSIL